MGCEDEYGFDCIKNGDVKIFNQNTIITQIFTLLFE